ncbi:hypothetical protein [Helicobacter vulpis]|uniref:hypothetical protein n=1 Tax=Helicobacter vulpis TaxID=2316076 RepID=UPI001F368BDE|nr:hypothetical protein [Helicobacter vulpis]
MSMSEIRSDKRLYQSLNTDACFMLNEENDYLCLYDKYSKNSTIGGSYYVQDIWGARKVLESRPQIHYDVGSSIQGFIAHLLVFCQKVVLIDIREQDNASLNTSFLNAGGGGGLLIYVQMQHI